MRNKRYATIEKRFKMYDRELYVAYDEDLVPRTNNNLELFNNTLKRPIRKNMGQKFSWFYIEHLGEYIAYFHNIMKEQWRVVVSATVACSHTVEVNAKKRAPPAAAAALHGGGARGHGPKAQAADQR